MMKDLTLTKEEAKESGGCCIGGSEENLPKFPYGTCLYLDNDTLEKLGISADVKAGTQISLMANGYITGTSQRQNQKGETYSSMDIQLTAMEVNGVPKTTADVATKLYGTDKS